MKLSHSPPVCLSGCRFRRRDSFTAGSIDRYLHHEIAADALASSFITSTPPSSAPRMAFHRLLGLPPELRSIVYEFVASDTTISLNGGFDSRRWPGICWASTQTHNEALPLVYQCAAFVADIWYLNFSQIIKFVEEAPPQCQQALQSNSRLTIYLTDQEQDTFFNMYLGWPPYPLLSSHEKRDRCLTLIGPWLAHCRSRAEAGRYIQYYQPKRNFEHSDVIFLSDSQWILTRLEYPTLRDLQESLDDGYEKLELTRIADAFSSYASSFFPDAEDSEADNSDEESWEEESSEEED